MKKRFTTHILVSFAHILVLCASDDEFVPLIPTMCEHQLHSVGCCNSTTECSVDGNQFTPFDFSPFDNNTANISAFGAGCCNYVTNESSCGSFIPNIFVAWCTANNDSQCTWAGGPPDQHHRCTTCWNRTLVNQTDEELQAGVDLWGCDGSNGVIFGDHVCCFLNGDTPNRDEPLFPINCDNQTHSVGCCEPEENGICNMSNHIWDPITFNNDSLFSDAASSCCSYQSDLSCDPNGGNPYGVSFCTANSSGICPNGFQANETNICTSCWRVSDPGRMNWTEVEDELVRAWGCDVSRGFRTTEDTFCCYLNGEEHAADDELIPYNCPDDSRSHGCCISDNGACDGGHSPLQLWEGPSCCRYTTFDDESSCTHGFGLNPVRISFCLPQNGECLSGSAPNARDMCTSCFNPPPGSDMNISELTGGLAVIGCDVQTLFILPNGSFCCLLNGDTLSGVAREYEFENCSEPAHTDLDHWIETNWTAVLSVTDLQLDGLLFMLVDGV